MGLVKGIAEIVLLVEDVKKTAEFYSDVVGLDKETTPDDDWAWFTVGNSNPQQRLALHRGKLLFEEESPFPEGNRFGRFHFALHIARSDLKNALNRVRKAGLEVYGPVRFDWMNAESHYFYDPDGYLVEYWSQD
jgi:catechol-2,3-dioxygenase